MRWQIATLILILAALGNGVHTTDKPADVRLRSQSASQSDGGSPDASERALRELLQPPRSADSSDGQRGRSEGKERLDDVVEATATGVDTDVPRAGNAPSATVPPTPASVPATPAAEATAQVEQPFGEIEQLICAKAWPCESALCIARAESGLDPNAYNPASGTTGIMQIRPSSHWQRVIDMGYVWDDLYRADVNIEVAYAIYLDWGGFGAFDGSPQCF